MTNQGSSYSHLPDGSRQHTFVVYHSESGEIVHGFTAIILPYGDAGDSDFERQAIEAAVNATGHDSSALQTLAIQHEDLEPGAQYRVDVATGEIVPHRDG